MNDAVIAELLAAIPQSVRDKSGTALYTGLASWTQPSPLYLMGINPGGEHPQPSAESGSYITELWNRQRGGMQRARLESLHQIVGPRPLHACDVGGEEVHAVAVEVSTGAVVVLGGSWVGVSGQDLCVTQWDSGIECVGDRSVPQGVRTDVAGDARCRLGDPEHHPVAVASVDRLAGQRPEDKGSLNLASACFRATSVKAWPRDRAPVYVAASPS